MSKSDTGVKLALPDGPEAAQLPVGVREFLNTVRDSQTNGKSITRDDLRGMFKNDPGVAESLISTGTALVPNTHGGSAVIGAAFDQKGHLISTAAAVPRNPGRSEEYLEEIEDFTAGGADRTRLIELYDRVYRREGLANNAINKVAALVATDGDFKVRYVRGKRGVSGNARAEEFLKILNFWKENVNKSSDTGAVKSDRGLKAFISQGTRMALKEGDHFGRQVWTNVAVPQTGKTYSLPMTLQTFAASTIEIPDGLSGVDLSLYYWVPPTEFVSLLRDPPSPEVKQMLDKLVPSDVKNAILKDGKYLLDPALVLHVKHRGTATSNFGESMLEAAMNDIAYKRALQALDMVTIENLINRLVIIKVGSDDVNSVYHSQEVTSARMAMMAQMLRRIGPSATIIWPGPDVDIVEVGAYNKVMEMDERYKQAESRIRSALGVPSALLSGESSDSKAVGWAAVLGVAAQLKELQNQYAQIFRSIAERIALENGFEEVDVIWEFSGEPLRNREQHDGMVFNAWKGGVLSVRTVLEELGFEFTAEEVRMLEEVALGYRETPFGAPPAYAVNMNNQGENNDMDNTEENGRPPGEERTEEDPRQDQELEEPEERN